MFKKKIDLVKQENAILKEKLKEKEKENKRNILIIKFLIKHFKGQQISIPRYLKEDEEEVLIKIPELEKFSDIYGYRSKKYS